MLMPGGKIDPFVRMRRIAEALIYLYIAKVISERKGFGDVPVRNREVLRIFSRNGVYYRTMNYRDIVSILSQEGLIIPYETKTHLEIRLTPKGVAFATRIKPFIESFFPLNID